MKSSNTRKRSLVEIQNSFFRELTARSQDCSGNGGCFLSPIDTPILERSERLSIYRNNIQVALSKTLQQTYHTCLRLVGKEYFLQIISSYIKETPSQTQDLNDYGQTFANFLARVVEERDEAHSLCYLPDVARLEWSIHLSSRAANDLPFDFESFAKLDEDQKGQLRFILNSSAQLLSSPYPVHKIWEANQTEQKEKRTIDLTTEDGENLFIWRNGLQVHVEPIENLQLWDLLQAVQRKKSLENISIEASSEDVMKKGVSLVSGLIEKGWIVDFLVE